MSENNDFPEKDQAREEAVGILINAFKQAKQGRAMSRTISAFWAKTRSKAPQELVNALEQQPEAPETQEALNEFLKERMTKTLYFLGVLNMVETFKTKG